MCEKFWESPVEASAEPGEVPAEPPTEPNKNPLEAATEPVEVPLKPSTEPVGNKKTVSDKKVAANRNNAQKSTGPKTPRGKANSRRNAVKHGLFAMELSLGELTRREDPKKYQEHMDQLRRYFKPVGRPEENEVALMCTSWCMRDRVWRCLNATVISSQFDITCRETKMRAEDLTCIELLRTARVEVKATGDMSAELGEKLCAHQGFEELWERLEKIVKDRPQMAKLDRPNQRKR